MQRATKFALLAFVLLASNVPMTAGAIPPCVKAASSINGNALVLAEVRTGDTQHQAGTVQGLSCSVTARERLLYANNKTILSMMYWDRSTWLVILDASETTDSALTSFCPLPLITDDGEFLVLLSTGSGYLIGPARRIYRRRDHLGDPIRPGPDNGVLVKDITLKELWPADRDSSAAYSSDNDVKEWYAGGKFEFSADNRQLIHRTRWGNKVSINLSDGSLRN
jgi:hypothetical protein